MIIKEDSCVKSFYDMVKLACIGENGRISKVVVTESTVKDKNVGKCIQRKVKGWLFDRPEGGSVTFSYPFVFAPQN